MRSKWAGALILFLVALGSFGLSASARAHALFDGTPRWPPAVPLATVLEDSTGEGELDWFVFNATEGTRINITVTWANPAHDIDIFLFSPTSIQQQRPIAESAAIRTNREQIALDAPETGRYLLLVFPFRVPMGARVAYQVSSNILLSRFVTMYQVTVQLTGLTERTPTNVTFTFLGVARTEQVAQSFQLFADGGTNVTLLPTLPVSRLERIHTADPSSRRIIAPATFSVTYFHQVLPRVSLEGLSPEYPAHVTTTVNAKDQRTRSVTEWSDWVDRDSIVSIERTITATPGRRFHTVDAVRWRADLPFEARVTFYEQWKPSVSIQGVVAANPVGVTYRRNGQSLSQHGLVGTWSDWVDHGSIVSFTPEALGSTSSERWRAERTDFLVRGLENFALRYTRQFRVTVIVQGVTEAPVVLAAVTQFNRTRQVSVTGEWTDWVDAGTDVSLPRSLADGRGSRWTTRDATRLVVRDAGTFILRYAPEHRVTLTFSTAEGQVLPAPLPTRVELVDAEGNSHTVSAYETVWVAPGLWRVQDVIWQGANVAPGLPTTFTPAPGATWVVATRVRDLTVQVTDFAGIAVSGAEVVITYPDGRAYRTTTDERGQARIPATYPGASLLRVAHFGLSAVLADDVSQLREAVVRLQLPLSTPSAVLVTLLILAVIAGAVVALRRRG